MNERIMTTARRCLGAATVLLFALAWSPPGLAQNKGDKPPPGVDPKKLEEAKKHMAAGAALYNDPSGHKCEEAYVEFNKAYEISGSLNALKNRAACALELEKDGEALADYKKVLAGMGDKIDAGEKKQIEDDVRALESATAWVTIKLDVPKASLLDVRSTARGFSIKNRYELPTNSTKLGIHPGEHTLTVTTEDGKSLTWNVTLANGSSQEHLFELTKPVTAPTASASASAAVHTERPIPLSVKVMLGVTGAFAVGTGVMMGLAGASRSDYENNVNGKTNDQALLDSKRNEVILMNGIADGLLGGTVLAAGGTLVLFLLRPTVQVEDKPAAGFFLAPAVSPNAAGLITGGKF